MPQLPDDLDRRWDALLHRVGPRLDIPDDPGPARRRRWRTGRRAGWLARHRVLTMWTGSGALAAAVVLAVVVLMSPRMVDARVIFADLRQALQRNMRMSFENVEVDLARLRPDLGGRVFLSGSVLAADLRRHKAYAEVDVTLEAGSGESCVPPLDLRVVTAAVSGAEWVYLRLRDPTLPVGGIDPGLALLAEAARQGVYVQLPGVLKTDAGRLVKAWPALGLKVVYKLRDREGLDMLIDLVERYGGQVSVQCLSEQAGEYRLTARGFQVNAEASTPDRHSPRQLLAGFLSSMEMNVFYSRGRGVYRLEIDRVGHASGKVVVELDGVEFDDGLLDMARHQEQQPGLILNPAALGRLWS